jgi:hypothetical protein
VRPDGAVLPSPVLDQPLVLKECGEDLPVEKSIPELSIERFMESSGLLSATADQREALKTRLSRRSYGNEAPIFSIMPKLFVYR